MKINRLPLITALACASFSTMASAALLTVTNNNSRDPSDIYTIAVAGLDNGELVQIDRNHVFADLPAFMVGLDYVMTANDDKTADSTYSVDLTFDTGTTLYLSIDNRVGDGSGAQDNPPTLGGGVMDWVIADGWAATGSTWRKENEAALFYSVYSLTPTSTSYTFHEQNDGGSRNHYSIAGGVVPEPSSGSLMIISACGLLLRRRRRAA